MIRRNVGAKVLNYAAELLKVHKFKNESVPVQTMRVYNVNDGYVASLIINLGYRWK